MRSVTPLPPTLSGNILERLIRLDEALIYLVGGSLEYLTDKEPLEETGALTVEQARAALSQMLWDYYHENIMEYPKTFDINPLTARRIAGTTLSRVVSTAQLYNIVVEITPAAINNFMQFDFYCAKGAYDLKIMGARGTNYGIVSLNVDGVAQADEQTWYNAANTNNIEYTYEIEVLTDGNHSLDMYTVAKTAASTGYRFFMSSITGKRTGAI